MTASEIFIRVPTAADRPQWEQLWQGYLQFYQSTLDADVSNLLWQRLLDPANEIECRIAANQQKVALGLVHFFPHAHTWYANPVCYLNDLYVSTEARGDGIGAALIQAVIDTAKLRDWAEVYWHTQEHNRVARGLYDKLTGGTDGFINYCVVTQPSALNPSNV